MTRFFLDTEFIEDGRTIDLVSIALVTEDGRELYLCNTEARLDLANAWVRQNVLPNLPSYKDVAWLPHIEIREQILAFVGADKPELWAYYADYDWVVFCQLFGRMIDLPKGWPMWCRDLKQLSESLGNPQHPPQLSVEHNALADARYNLELWQFLLDVRARQTGHLG